MKILAVDVGTGTQDILLFDTRLNVENSFKLVVPSPTMIINRKIKTATKQGDAIVLTGVTMGGGPSHWAAMDHLKAGYEVYATPLAAKSFNDDLEEIQEMGFQIVSEDEVVKLPSSVSRIKLKDFDFTVIADALMKFEVPMNDLAAVAVAVFDHGNAPPKYSDRQFRFDYISERISEKDELSTFAFMAQEIPESMTRMQSVVSSAQDVDVPLVIMDTAPAAILGASFDPKVQEKEHTVIANIGNFHTLAFRMHKQKIEGVFEHHTGLVDLEKVDRLIGSLADGTIKHEDVFMDHGHGAITYQGDAVNLSEGPYGVAVTGPRQSMMQASKLRPYFAAPFGDMMLAGCFGLLYVTGDLLPELKEPVFDAIYPRGDQVAAPWELA